MMRTKQEAADILIWKALQYVDSVEHPETATESANTRIYSLRQAAAEYREAANG